MQRIDQDLAKRLLVEGATFVALDVPPGTEFGIDTKQWETGENFRGIKMIPPGLHFIHYSPTDLYGRVSPKVGFFHEFKRSEFLVKRWNPTTEDFDNIDDETKVSQFRNNLRQLDSFLGPYPYDIWQKWTVLTSKITGNLIDKLSPQSGQIRSALDLESCSDADRPRQSTSSCIPPETTRRKKSLLPDLKPLPGTELRLTPFPEFDYPEGSTPAEITRHSLDRTYALETMLRQHNNNVDFIGELQFAYACFLVGNSLEAFEHWKMLVSLVCSCDDAIKRYREVYDEFVSTLEAQIIETPEDFLADIVSNNNIVYVKLRQLFRTVEDRNDVDGRLTTKFERFKRNLTERYEWDFSHLESDDEDEAPVIVEVNA